MANSFAPFSRHGLTYSLGFITMRQMIQFYVLFVQNKMEKIICCLLRRKSKLLFRLDILTVWKKALQRFKEHQCSECHKLSVDYEVNILKTHNNIYELSNERTKKVLKSDHRCFIKVIECPQHMSRQGQPL